MAATPDMTIKLDSDDLRPIAALLEEVRNTIDAIRSARLICVGCRIENHLGQRAVINPAVAVVNGMSVCLEHWQIVDGPVMPDRTPGGIVLPGQINGS